MNKTELIEKMAQKMGTSKEVASSALNAFIETVTEALKSEGIIKLIGFGTFSLKEQEARKIKNPKTGEDMIIEARTVPVFKMSKNFKKLFY